MALIVSKFNDGDLIKSTSKEGQSKILVKDIVPVLSKDGFVNLEKRAFNIKAETDFIQKLNVKEGQDLTPMFNKRIIVFETTNKKLVSEYTNPKINPSTGAICLSKDGDVIYRETKLATIGSEEDKDIFVEMPDKVGTQINVKSTIPEEIGR